MSDSRLAVSGLSVERGAHQVVHDVSLEVPAGEVTALLGPNGPASRVSCLPWAAS